jgi:hypothetical protein
METGNKEFNEKAGLELIGEMIQSARQDIQDNGFFYLLWGWLVFAASLIQFVLFDIVHYPKHYIVWIILTPLGGIVSAVYGYRESRRPRVRTYTDAFIGYLWGGFYAMLLMVLFFMPKIGYHTSYILIMMLYGFGTFVSGGALRFRPLIIGGVASWILAVISFYVSFSTVLLLTALSILISYIIPGHMLRARYGKKNV